MYRNLIIIFGYELCLANFMELCVLLLPTTQQVGGFKESCSAKRPCRHCMTDSSDLSYKFKESRFQLQNPADHATHLLQVQGSGGNDATKEFGINRRSVLDELQYFKVSSGSLIPDVMHDVLEGVPPV